jgi:tetratricopeptide (TPR) repeat protein
MAERDSRDLAISTQSAEAASAYRDAVDLILSAWPGASEALNRAIASDPNFALAHATLARTQAMRGQAAQAKASIDIAQDLAARNATTREHSHVSTISLVIQGQSKKALTAALAHLERWPRDAIILSLPLGAFGLFAFSGMADHDQARVDLCERVADQYSCEDWWFLTYRGWSHTENGNLLFGRELTVRGFELRRANANAAHALSHAMFESGAGDDAETLIESWLPSYDRSGPLHGHIAWHAALSALERHDVEKALALYETYVKPSISLGLPINILTDAVSLLWRFKAYGHSIPVRLWDEVKSYAEARFATPSVAFVETHMGLLLAAAGDRAAAEARIATLTRLAEGGSMLAGNVVPVLCRSFLAFAEGDYAECIRLLAPIRSDVARIGGSGAQREIIEDTLLLALMRNGETRQARAVLDQRLHRRPSPRDTRWLADLPD